MLLVIKKQSITNERVNAFFHRVVIFSALFSIYTVNPAFAVSQLVTDDLSRVNVNLNVFNDCEAMESMICSWHVEHCTVISLNFLICNNYTWDNSTNDITQAGIEIEKNDNYLNQEDISYTLESWPGTGSKSHLQEAVNCTQMSMGHKSLTLTTTGLSKRQ